MKSCGSAFRLLRANGLAGVRARVCVCVQDSGPPGSWARLLGCPVAILCPQCPPALRPRSVRSAGGACVDTAGRVSAAGGWPLDVGALRREIREGGGSAGVETPPLWPPFSYPLGPLAEFTLERSQWRGVFGNQVCPEAPRLPAHGCGAPFGEKELRGCGFRAPTQGP